MKPLRAGDPRQMGPYQLQGRLGGGGMGQVFLGRSRGGRSVAVKVVRPELADDAGFRRRFAIEVEAARRVGGFYTAQVVDANTDADPPWMATAYIPGPSLHDAVTTRGPLPPTAVGVLGAGLAEGLAAIQDCKLVHRDLKPGNVILAADGPRVIDFGIARALDSTSYTATGVVIGTPAFMSPEQVHGDEVGLASDVFSLGAVLVFAATGRGPFGDGHHRAIMNRIVHDDADLTGLPPGLVDLVGACLSKAPENRPGLTDLLDRLAASAQDATRWLPPQVTEMITQLETTALQRRPETNGAFEMSWTGEEPPSTYAEAGSEPAEYSMVLPVILLLVGAAGALISWWLDPSVFSVDAHPGVNGIPAFLGAISGGLGLIGALVVIKGNGDRRREMSATRPYPHRTSWSLHVGPNYIVTTGATGRREFTWDQIRRVTIEQIKGAGPDRYTGIHLYIKGGARQLPPPLPAGWPYPAPTSIKPYSTHLVDAVVALCMPICVLGPMTHEQRTELTQALAQFGGRRWQPHGGERWSAES
ncbi:serine/threonine-protein kinase [Nonomuraea sp. NPDC049028]|uniref:serine/threonine-protein kinase n=1 Tax=Nonomuraea sp. NPDC049028 TaxID=3364348 RepID=UPI00371A4114